MPEKRKEKKTRDIIQETKGGAEIFMPSRKRKRQIKYPKNFDPKNPGQEPDPESGNIWQCELLLYLGCLLNIPRVNKETQVPTEELLVGRVDLIKRPKDL